MSVKVKPDSVKQNVQSIERIAWDLNSKEGSMRRQDS
jgi:hypothetical protein